MNHDDNNSSAILPNPESLFLEEEECGHDEESTSSSSEDESEDEDGDNSHNILLLHTTDTTEEDIGQKAILMRTLGKEHHGAGDLKEAAHWFDRAAQLLEDHSSSSFYLSEEESLQNSATCRLHQALCYLKLQEYEECRDICSTIITNSNNKFINNTPIIARAHHRHAKARLAMDDLEGALQDARTAAFSGDQGAVQLYGTLMRESGDVSTNVNGNGTASSSLSLFPPSMWNIPNKEQQQQPSLSNNSNSNAAIPNDLFQ